MGRLPTIYVAHAVAAQAVPDLPLPGTGPIQANERLAASQVA